MIIRETTETEKSIPGFEDYLLRTDGMVWNPYKQDWVQPYFDRSKGYRIIEILKSGKKNRLNLHHLMAQLFLDKPEGAKYVSFRDGDSSNVRVENIYWASSKSELTPKSEESKKLRVGNHSESTHPELPLLRKYYPKLLNSIPREELTEDKIDEIVDRTKETIGIMMAYPKHHDTVRKILYKGAQRRAKELGLPFNICAEDILLPTKCPFLGENLVYGQSVATKLSPSLDRIIPSLGYVKGNTEVISMLANNMKSHAKPEEIRAFAINALKRYP